MCFGRYGNIQEKTGSVMGSSPQQTKALPRVPAGHKGGETKSGLVGGNHGAFVLLGHEFLDLIALEGIDQPSRAIRSRNS